MSNGSKTFIPCHYPAIFDRTLNPASKGEGLVCALLCATALEAFVHDFISMYNFAKSNLMTDGSGEHPSAYYLTEDERHLLDQLMKSESDYESVTKKYSYFFAWDKGQQTYQNFKKLITIRNELAHLKPEELNMDSENEIVDGYPKFLNDFFQKRIIEKPNQLISWIEVIETKEFCLWCQKATHDMISETISKLPKTKIQELFSEQSDVIFNIDVFRTRYA